LTRRKGGGKEEERWGGGGGGIKRQSDFQPGPARQGPRSLDTFSFNCEGGGGEKGEKKKERKGGEGRERRLKADSQSHAFYEHPRMFFHPTFLSNEEGKGKGGKEKGLRLGGTRLGEKPMKENAGSPFAANHINQLMKNRKKKKKKRREGRGRERKEQALSCDDSLLPPRHPCLTKKKEKEGKREEKGRKRGGKRKTGKQTQTAQSVRTIWREFPISQVAYFLFREGKKKKKGGKRKREKKK